MKKTFTDIYESSRWGDCSGPGSTVENVEEYLEILSRFIQNYNVKSIADIGCGHGHLPRDIDMGDISYTGYDCVLDIVNKNREKFPQCSFEHVDVTSRKISGSVDLVIIKDVCQHLPFLMIKELLKNIPKSKYTIVVDDMSSICADTDTGGYRPLNPYGYHSGSCRIIGCYNYNINGMMLTKHVVLLSSGVVNYGV